MKQQSLLRHLAVAVVFAAASVFAQGSADNPELVDDGIWRTTPWLDRFVPDDFIYARA